MLIENTHIVSEQDKAAQKKPWQTPQCASKKWQTPRLLPMPFTETLSGSNTGPENASNHS
jgi:hypothetical protein